MHADVSNSPVDAMMQKVAIDLELNCAHTMCSHTENIHSYMLVI